MRSLYQTTLILVHVAIATAQFTPVLDSLTGAFVEKVLVNWESPTGIAVAVVRRNAQGKWNVETTGYGQATLDGSKNVTEKTLFGIGSNSKLFTAVAAGLLTHDSRVSPPLTWTSRMKDILPGWGLVNEIASQEATVQDLMSHRTGVPRHDASVRRADTDQDIIRKVRNQRPAAPFRDIWQYNNNMYKILGTLAPTLLPSKPSHARYVKDNIFDKLGLNSTTYNYAVANSTGEFADGVARVLVGSNVTFRALPYWIPDSGEDGDNDSGDGGIISSATDLATWLQTLLLNGANPKTNESVIPSDVIRRLATGYSVESGAATFPELSPVVYGAGQERGSYRGQEFIEHAGAVPGYNSVISRYPNSNTGVAVLSNDDEIGGLLVRIVAYYLADKIFGLEPVDWNGRYRSIYLAPGDSSAGPTPRPVNATFPYGDIKKVEGVYDNAGYGKTEFCYATANPTSSPTVSGSSKSCNALRAGFVTVLPQLVQPGVPTFIAPWNTTTLSHVILRHFDGGIFNISAINAFPTGDASNPYWIQDVGLAETTGEVDKGLTGIGFNGVWGSVPGVPEPSGNTPKERAEVWFDRV